MLGDFDIYGVYMPGLLGMMFLTLLLSAMVRRALAWVGIYAWVWHRGLFDVALYVVLLGATVSLTQWLVS
ncbi:Protein of unknown function [Phyllobacterium sp. YR620]|uniref:DUF1656 domain-containing protein n=1 Tax=Phyllobacterium TaxID=28100 RepID=UPI000482CF77|nr:MULTISPECIES: DUF1656 domain-containing protein [unclassified Phyllobacterium]UGY11610.1 DUF1656 domain-containing protein [Phyllobacterium sp. T1018]SDP84375.1 Protein of unknown function [Phyllobacterium sp. YR620]SFJ24376.1 Protein of unknown function [Phyllobacterium sp. CL33Tsu]